MLHTNAQHFKTGHLASTCSFYDWTHLKPENTVCFICRNPLSEILRLLWRLPHRLLRLPAVLHQPAELSLHLLLQHAALQWAQEEASCPFSGDVQPTEDPASPPLAHRLPAAAVSPFCDVDWRSHHASAVQFVLIHPNHKKVRNLVVRIQQSEGKVRGFGSRWWSQSTSGCPCNFRINSFALFAAGYLSQANLCSLSSGIPFPRNMNVDNLDNNSLVLAEESRM